MKNHEAEYYNTAEDAIRSCANILSKAEKYIYFVSGEINADFYENDEIKNVLENKLLSKDYKNIDIKMVFGPNIDIRSTTILKLAMLGELKIRRLNKRHENHFKIIDDQHVYFADYHEPLSLERTGSIYHDKKVALKKKEEFNNLWENAEEFDIRSILNNLTPVKEINGKEGKWGIDNGFITKDSIDDNYKIATTIDIINLKTKLGTIINIPISETNNIRRNFLYDMSKKSGRKRAEQFKIDMIKYIENESSNAGIVLTEDAKETFLDLLLSVMVKTDKYIKERNIHGTVLSILPKLTVL